ncbi:hypothetical protein F4778DRAFT_764594 [Xylariomycetidae sp. FL2044]|nr:hypothetical protein F4778DRAFT_764594 [Xylariomycetidae sp. FL2044]
MSRVCVLLCPNCEIRSTRLSSSLLTHFPSSSAYTVLDPPPTARRWCLSTFQEDALIIFALCLTSFLSGAALLPITAWLDDKEQEKALAGIPHFFDQYTPQCLIDLRQTVVGTLGVGLMFTGWPATWFLLFVIAMRRGADGRDYIKPVGSSMLLGALGCTFSEYLFVFLPGYMSLWELGRFGIDAWEARKKAMAKDVLPMREVPRAATF